MVGPADRTFSLTFSVLTITFARNPQPTSTNKRWCTGFYQLRITQALVLSSTGSGGENRTVRSPAIQKFPICFQVGFILDTQSPMIITITTGYTHDGCGWSVIPKATAIVALVTQQLKPGKAEHIHLEQATLGPVESW